MNGSRPLIVLVALFALGSCGLNPTISPTTAPTGAPTTPAPTTAAPTDAPTTPTPTTAGPTEPTPAIPHFQPVFEPASCQFVNSYLYDVECGDLIVPEDRRRPDGPTVRLHVAIFRSTGPNPAPDPVIYLAGGGGVNQLDSSGYYLRAGGYEILETRDYIMYNQRGAHYNEPSLECRGYNEFLTSLAGQTLGPEEHRGQKIAFLLGCRDDLIGRGINLEMYNSAVNAADANDLRIALGYEQVNYYGTSYGTRLALTLMREYPESIRSVIIDSVFPPQVNYQSEFAPNAYRAFNKFFESCAADPSCNETYPDLEETFYQVIDELNAHPASMTWMGNTVIFDGGTFADAIYLFLYAGDVASAPQAIYEASGGNFSPVEPYVLGVLDLTTVHINWGAYYSIHCSEEILLDSLDRALTLAANLPPPIADYYLFSGTSSVTFHFILCESWGVEPAGSIETEPVVSDIPTLLLAGQFDPITPPEWAQLAAETLSNSTLYEFPGLGHGVMRSNRCAFEIGLQFIHDPTTEPDASCINELPGPDFQ